MAILAHRTCSRITEPRDRVASRLSLGTALSAALIACTAVIGAEPTTTSEDAMLRLSASEYQSKLVAGWLGQMAGVGWGAPTEFRWNGKTIPERDVPQWRPEMINQFEQDDIYVEMTFLRTLELHGWDVPIRQAGIDFANSGYMLWHANNEGRTLLRQGIAPPDSGHPKFNSHADDIDYQIEADYSGLIAPGMPNVAIELGEKFGRLMNYGDGVYGGQFVGAMYSAAFFETDMEQVVRAGLAAIPGDSQYHECISDVLNWYRSEPHDWQQTWKKVDAKYQRDRNYRRFSCTGADSEFNIDVKLNGAYIVMGLLFGHGDPDQTIVIAMRCGADSDCNPSNAGGILFTSMGLERVPDRFKQSLDRTKQFSHTEYSFTRLITVCEELARQAVVRSGGRIETQDDDDEVFLIPLKPATPSPLVQSHTPGPIAESRFSAEEMKAITTR